MIGAIAAALTYAPSILKAGIDIFNAITGKELPPETSATDLNAAIEELPADQKGAVVAAILAYQQKVEEFDTDRFKLLTEGDADKVRATARPEIAQRAMGVIEIFSKAFKWLVVATFLELLVKTLAFYLKVETPAFSLWSTIAEMQPVAEVIWAPLVASFWVCADVIKKYMGCRERDKAQEYEILAGKPLNASQATIEAAGSAAAKVIKAWRTK